MATIIDKFVSLLTYKSDKTGIVESEAALRNLEHQTEKTNEVMEALKRSLELIGIGLGLEKIIEFSGEWETAANKLRSVGIAGQRLVDVENKLLNMSIKTGTTVEANAELYQQLSASMGDTVSQVERLQVVDTLTKIFAMSGTTTGQASAAISDMSKALEGATVRWAEIKRAMQDVPALQNVISKHFKELGTTYTDALEGNKFATADFIKILEDSNTKVTKSFNQMHKTIPMAFNAIKQSMVAFFGTLFDNVGIADIFTGSLFAVANGLVKLKTFIVDNGKEFKKWGEVAGAVLVMLSARFAFLAYRVITPMLIRAGLLLAPLIAIGLAIQDFITYLQGGDSVFGRFANWLGLSKDGVKDIALALGAGIGVFALYRTAIMLTKTAVEVFTGVMALFDVAMDANPIGAVIIALAAMAAGLVYLQEKFHIFNKGMHNLTATFTFMKDEIMKVAHAVEYLYNKLNILGKVKSFGRYIGGGIESAGKYVASGLTGALNFLGTSIVGADASRSSIVQPALNKQVSSQSVTNNINVNVSHQSTTASAQDIANTAVDALKKHIGQSYRAAALSYASGVKA